MIVFKIAWRNILRNKRRSALSITIIVIGVSVLFLFKGYMAFNLNGLTELAISEYGNLQIAAAGYWDNTDERHLLSKNEINRMRGILTKDPAVNSFATQLNVSGVIGTETKSAIIYGLGVEPDKYQNTNVTGGTLFSSQAANEVILGDGVRKKLGVKEGEWLSILATTLDGAYNAGNLQVSGSISFGNSDADNAYIVLPVNFTQNLLNTDGADKLIVHLSNDQLTVPTIHRLTEEFEKAGLKVELKNWVDLATYYRQANGMMQTTFMVISLIIFILVFFSILEIMSMAFFERMSEIGTIRAIGTKRFQVFSLLSQEGLLLGLLGGLMGVAMGWGLGALIDNMKMTYLAPGFAQPVPLYINLNLEQGIAPMIIVMFAILISASYPALKAARLNIVEIFRHH